MRENPDVVVIAWFNTTPGRLEKLVRQENGPATNIYLAREVHTSLLAGKKVVFAEHHPLRSKEQALYRQSGLREAVVYSALDEPLFKQFGSERIIQMMQQLGMKEDEMIEHALVTSAIENAQEKIEKKVQVEHTASSQQEWMERNLR
jgi:hypothetical protein